ncbi:hypothetical protein [Streptomyces atratus]|uniref:hypothetical protein n=1 Tax=Streptomyces atratus TaxID=1893 RepID=UPI003651111D
MKIGITNVGTKRLAEHRRDGWSIAKTQYFAFGSDAYDVEQAVLYACATSSAFLHICPPTKCGAVERRKPQTQT